MHAFSSSLAFLWLTCGPAFACTFAADTGLQMLLGNQGMCNISALHGVESYSFLRSYSMLEVPSSLPSVFPLSDVMLLHARLLEIEIVSTNEGTVCAVVSSVRVLA